MVPLPERRIDACGRADAALGRTDHEDILPERYAAGAREQPATPPRSPIKRGAGAPGAGLEPATVGLTGRRSAD